MAYSLFCTRNTTGARKTAAKFIASWKSPSLVAPSPQSAMTTVDSPRNRAACATPTACSNWVASGVAWGARRGRCPVGREEAIRGAQGLRRGDLAGLLAVAGRVDGQPPLPDQRIR